MISTKAVHRLMKCTLHIIHSMNWKLLYKSRSKKSIYFNSIWVSKLSIHTDMYIHNIYGVATWKTKEEVVVDLEEKKFKTTL